jgi:pimeloyl-ACP methyl ester carboxylesterase
MVTKSTTHHRCVANGIKFHYAEAGEGPPVVLLHGFPETSYAWRHQIEALKTRYRLIVPDHVNQAHEGADFDFLVGASGPAVETDSH